MTDERRLLQQDNIFLGRVFMAPELIQIIARLQDHGGLSTIATTPLDREQVLLEDGLPLLSAYLRVADAELRQLLKGLIVALAAPES